jgi:hypothetical protein
MQSTMVPAPDASSAANELTAMAERAVAGGNLDVLSDAQIEHILTAMIRLYAAKNEGRDVLPRPITPEAVTPTEVVTVVTEALRAANLNLWDLSMWLRRSGI